MSTETPPAGPSTVPTIDELRSQLATLREQVANNANLPQTQRDRLNRDLQEAENNLDQQRLKEIEKAIKDITDLTAIEPSSAQPSTTDELSGLLGQQTGQFSGAIDKLNWFQDKLVGAFSIKFLGIGAMLKKFFKDFIPEEVMQEWERKQSSNQIIDYMKTKLGPKMAPHTDGDITHYLAKIDEIRNTITPKPELEAFCKQKIDKLETEFPTVNQYSLAHVLSLARIENGPQAAAQQKEQAQENIESLEGRKKRAYALALVNAFNEAAGSTIVILPAQDTKNNLDYARDIGTLLADALANESYENTLELELDPHLEATDTCNSWYTAGIADYDFLPDNNQPDTSTLYGDLISAPEKAFQTLLAINSSPLDTTSRNAINKIQASLNTAQRTMSRDLQPAPPSSTKPASVPRPAPTQTAAATPPADPTASTDPSSTATV